MKIINLKAENIKKIKAVDITPVDNTVVISGKNGQGKSSILDSILFALGGKDALKDTPKPIRDGEDHATVEIDLGDYRVVRTWSESGTTRLEVFSPEGAKFASPQTLLDEIVGRIAFDPLAFANMKPNEQRSILLDVLGLTDKVAKLQDKYRTKFEERTLIGRDLKNAQGHVASLPVVENPPKELVDTVLVSRKLQEAQQTNDIIDELEQERDSQSATIVRLKTELKDAKEALALTEKNLKKRTRKKTGELEEILANSDKLNQAYRNALELTNAEQVVSKHLKEQKELTAELDILLQEKEKLITSAKLPIKGLNIDVEGVTFNDMPFTQLSSAEQLKVSLAIAMAMNPKLRVMRIMDGSLLDSDNMKVISEMAKDQDYQIWIERVEDNGKVGILIENGEVKK